jgi:hypothetical protein
LDVLTTFIDLYALPKDFPGHAESIAQGLTGGQKAARVEQAWKEDIGRRNFFPYIQVHEFETLVLTRPSELAGLYAEHSASIEQLRIECAGFLTPEDINETREGSPSHRITARVPNYVKVEGFRFLQSIGVPELKADCPHFRAWIEGCEISFR